MSMTTKTRLAEKVLQRQAEHDKRHLEREQERRRRQEQERQDQITREKQRQQEKLKKISVTSVEAAQNEG